MFTFIISVVIPFLRTAKVRCSCWLRVMVIFTGNQTKYLNLSHHYFSCLHNFRTFVWTVNFSVDQLNFTRYFFIILSSCGLQFLFKSLFLPNVRSKLHFSATSSSYEDMLHSIGSLIVLLIRFSFWRLLRMVKRWTWRGLLCSSRVGQENARRRYRRERRSHWSGLENCSHSFPSSSSKQHKNGSG